MKYSNLLPLFLGLVLAGCSRTETDTKKISSKDQSDANRPAYDATTPKPASADPSQVAMAPPPAPVAAPSAIADTSKTAPDSASLAANSMPAASTMPAPALPDSSLTTTNSTPAASATPEPVVASNDFKPVLADRITEWKLTPADIKDELQSSGRIVRSRTPGAGEPTGPMDAILASSINSKLQDDASITALKIAVEADKGVVTLNGTAQSPEQLGHIIALSLDTDGVTQVVSVIKLETAP